MKRIIALFFVFLICITPCFAEEFTNPPITDGAEYLTSGELEGLSAKLEEIRQKYTFEVAIVTENEMSGTSAMASADDIYDYNGYGAGANDDGIMLYICRSTREYHITTHADGMRVFNERGIKYLKNNLIPYLESDDYYHAMVTFADLADELLNMAANGEPFNEKQHETKDILIILACAVLIPLLIAHIKTSNQLKKMKTAVENDYAANYVKEGSKRLDFSRDIFMYSNITKTEKAKNDSGSHKSSSGRTHGGGGGSF
ncbi:MAG: TPM domain-containing protein [Clostridia bacterium]|nr:TPM domain-containing protein [Clostridia bacterium]